MGLNQISNLNEEIQKTHDWVGQVARRMNTNKQNAYHATRSVFHALRDRLPVEEAVDLSAQMPVILKGVFFDGYKPAGKPEKIKTKEEFLQKVEKEAHDPDLDPVVATDAVMDVLKENVSEGEIEDVRDTLPENLKDLLAGE